jgi:hypothetical protein
MQSRLVEMTGKKVDVEIIWVFSEFAFSSELLSKDHLRDLQDHPITRCQVSSVDFKDTMVLSRFEVLIKKKGVKGKIEFYNWKVFEVFHHAFYGQDPSERDSAII